MSIAQQMGFWGHNMYIGDCRAKLLHLHSHKPDSFAKETCLYYEYWCEFDELEQVLEEKAESFKNWLINKATPTNTISRAYRSLKEDGSIKLTAEEKEQRQEQGNQWRQFWSNEKQLREDNGNGHAW